MGLHASTFLLLHGMNSFQLPTRWTICIPSCMTFWILNHLCTWASLFSILPPSFVINSVVSLSLLRCSHGSPSWTSVLLTAYFHALPFSMSLLWTISSFLRAYLGWDGGCLSLSLQASWDLLTLLSETKSEELCATGNEVLPSCCYTLDICLWKRFRFWFLFFSSHVSNS